MSSTLKLALAGAGAFGIKHLDALKQIPDVEVVSLVSREMMLRTSRAAPSVRSACRPSQ